MMASRLLLFFRLAISLRRAEHANKHCGS